LYNSIYVENSIKLHKSLGNQQCALQILQNIEMQATGASGKCHGLLWVFKLHIKILNCVKNKLKNYVNAFLDIMKNIISARMFVERFEVTYRLIINLLTQKRQQQNSQEIH
jgi:hypothetical protein